MFYSEHHNSTLVRKDYYLKKKKAFQYYLKFCCNKTLTAKPLNRAYVSINRDQVQYTLVV